VDDHEVVRRGIRSLLASRKDWVVCGEATDGVEAVEKAKSLRPDLALMDISMPRMNGLDATRIIRRELPECQVVVVSMSDPAIASRLAQEVDAAGYVAKSETPQKLLSTIDGVVGRRQAALPNGGANVIESAASQQGAGVETSVRDGAAALESILCTEELQRRPSRPPNYELENRALVALAQALADSPRTILQTQAGSAGISLLTTHDGGKRFYWPAIAGLWKPHIGGGTPRDFGPCGDVLDRNVPLLFRHIEQRYTYFQPVTPAVEECLLVPIYVEGKAVGTIWAVAHDASRKFDAEDERLMSSLGKFASSAYQIHASLDALQFQMGEREKAETALRRDFAERAEAGRAAGLLAAIVDSSDDAIISKNLDGVITSWNKSAERLFGHTAQEAIGQHITLIIPPDRLGEETTILERLKRGERVDHFETVRVRKDGTTRDISLTISPVRDASGRVIGASKVARDVTERKQIERALQDSEKRLRAVTDTLETQVRLRTAELQQRNQEVLMQSEQLRELSHRLMQIQDDERRHIARELHDSAGQMLAALGMNLANLVQQTKKVAPILAKDAEEAQGVVRELSQEIRTTSYLLHPPLLDESGLSEALLWYIQGLKERSGLDIELAIAQDFGRLSHEMELVLFRVVQECLTNVHRHSGSKIAAIRIARDGRGVSLEVQDEGQGISPEKLAEIRSRGAGVGLRGMRERVLQLGGELRIQSEGRGTKISVTLPVAEPANSKTTGPGGQVRSAR
jgi:PAS domain S-box-containing protein